MASKGRHQLLQCQDGYISLLNGKPGQSLGADDGVGVWLMLEMIAAGRPGLYVFHRGEEVGCLGSSWIVKNTPELLKGIKAAVAFDRQGTGDIITHQSNGRTCSDAFAKAFADQLNLTKGLGKFKPDDTGIYTDTNEYLFDIAECSNVSVGYYANHGPREELDVAHVTALLEAMLVFDAGILPVVREPAEDDLYGSMYRSSSPTRRPSDYKELFVDAIIENPKAAARFMEHYGLTYADFDQFLWDEVFQGVPLEEDDVAFDDMPGTHPAYQ